MDPVILHKIDLLISEVEFIKKNHLLKKRSDFRLSDNTWLKEYIERELLKL
jgi:hypothetical protein